MRVSSSPHQCPEQRIIGEFNMCARCLYEYGSPHVAIDVGQGRL